MQVELFTAGQQSPRHVLPHIIRCEIPFVAPNDEQYKYIILDADDSIDLIVHYPDGQREILFSVVKD